MSMEELKDHVLVDLINGRAREPTEMFPLDPCSGGAGFDVHMYALVRRQVYEGAVLAQI